MFGKYIQQNKTNVNEGTAEFLKGFTVQEFKELDKSNISAYMEMWREEGHEVNDNVKEFLENIHDAGDAVEDTADLVDLYTKSTYDAAEGTGKLSSQFGGFIKSLSSGALGVIKSVGIALVNMVASAALAAGITWLIGKVISLADALIITKKEASELAGSFRESFSSMIANQKKVGTDLESIDGEFKELSKGVNALGENVSLTDEEFERYHEITATIAQNIPSLIQGYDEQGNAIIRLTDNVKGLSEAYKETRQEEARALYNATDDKGQSIKEGVFKAAREGITSDYGDTVSEMREKYAQMASLDKKGAIELLRYSEDSFIQSVMIGAGMSTDVDKMLEMSDEEFDKVHTELIAQYREFESEIKQGAKDIREEGLAYAEGLSAFWEKLDDDQIKYFETFVNNLDQEFLEANDLYDSRNMELYMNSLIDVFDRIKDPKVFENLEMRFNLVTQFNSGEVSLGEYEEKLGELNAWLAQIPDDAPLKKIVEILFNVTADDEEDVEKKIDQVRSRVGYDYTERRHLSDENQKRNSEIDDWIRTLNAKQLDLIINSDIKFDGKTVPQMKTLLNELQATADANPIKVVTAVETNDAMAELKSAVSSLGDLYSQTVQDQLKLGKDKKYVDANGNVTKTINDQGYTVGYADPELINKVETAFSKFSATAEQNGKDVTVLNDALKTFEETLLKYPNDAERAQQAYDALITAYIDSTDILDGLTEETQEWCIAMLDAMDIENADMVVKSRLNKTTKNLISGYEKLRNAVIDYNKAVADNNTEGMSDGINNITNQLNDMYGFTNQKGEQVNPFDTEFVSQNLDMINAALDDATGKFNELDRMAAKAYILDLIVNTHDTEISMMYNELYNLIAAFDGESIDIGTSMDGTPVMNTLESIRKATSAAVTDWANMVSQMTGGTLSAEIGWETKHVQLNMPEFSYANYLSDENRGSITSKNVTKYQKTAVDYHLPKFTYTYTGKGTKANYRPSAPASSGGGGGGGGGGGSSSEPNKPKEEAEESFDWIEVAIQRIEEEIARLDKVVGNSYTAWIKRNDALLKEINKTKDEIKAQQLAYSEYLRNANKVQVNNGKGLNDDDYGDNDQLVKAADQKLLDEAKKAWATGQYQKKVREGLLTGDDIEKIQNHFLADTIKFYQELYNKAIAAGDAVEDLKIKLGDLARTNFDNVKSEYEEALAYFESYSSLIDERINRTEEKGYFVSKKYYQDLIAYDNKSLQKLKDEYNDLIKKRDEAVQSGAILSGSSEWNAMNQEILDVANSIEQATTKLVEFNNQMRQIDWDVFDYARDRINAVNDEFEFLIDLLDNQKLYDDWGIFNERGWADAALHAGKYNTLMQQSLDYAKEREKIEKELANDKANKDLIERREELIKLQQESIQNAYAEKEAVKSLVEEGINIHLQKLQETIDEYKKAIQDAKGLYDYQKNINNQVKNLTNLEKQLQAYSGDDSEEARATIQRLQKSLEDAQTQLKETQWDKYISETETFLSDMYDDYSETLNKRLDDIDLLMHDIVDGVNDHRSEITSITKEVANEVAYGLTSSLSTFLNGSNNVLVSDFKTRFDTYATTTEQSLNDIKNYVASISSNTVAEGVSNTEKVQNQSRVKGFNTVYNGVDYGSVFDLNYYMKKYPDLVKAFGNDYDKYLEHFVNHGMKEGRQASETFDVKYYRNKYADLNGHWGNDWEQYYKHFLNHGIQEGRQGSAEFDVQKYKASYTDLQKNLGNVLGRYYKHYNQYGISEGRQGNTFIRDGVDYSPVFDPKYYADRWSDLKKWYGYDSTKLFNHFVDHGMKEGRQASANFNPAKYKEYYKDLQNAFGSDWKKYFIHYLNHGIAEGRKGYKVGAHNISTAQMAWTQEAGGELIYRSTDGAILTPLNVGDKVFTAEMSENLWNLAQLKQRPYVPTNNGGKTINNSNAISITLPNVQNYEQFKTALQNDPKMTQFIQQITLGEATNGIKLNKKKF